MAPATAATSLFLPTDHSDTTVKPHNSEFCPPFPNAHFEPLDSSVPYIINAALNAPLAIATTFANFLVLLAMHHVTSLRLPSRLLLCSLVLTDLGVGLTVQPQLVALLLIKAINPYSVHSCSFMSSFGFAGSLFSSASLLTMMAISLDRYTALFFHLKYHQLLTTRRVCTVLTFVWSISLFSASMFLWGYGAGFTVLLITSLITCLIVISVAYIKIYRRLRDQYGPAQVQPQAHNQAQQAGNTFNVARYKRTASTMMWIYVLFIICYAPYLCGVSIEAVIGRSVLTRCILEFVYTTFTLNSCLNPFFYCLRLPEIRIEVIKQLRQICCRTPQ